MIEVKDFYFKNTNYENILNRILKDNGITKNNSGQGYYNKKLLIILVKQAKDEALINFKFNENIIIPQKIKLIINSKNLI